MLPTTTPIEKHVKEKKKAAPSAAEHAHRGNPVLLVVMILLILQVLLSGYQVYTSIVRDQQVAAQRAQLAASVAKYTATLDGLTTQMLQDYKKEVYNSQAVNTTSKQEVLGTEYNFMALMLVAKQNSKLMEILTQIR